MARTGRPREFDRDDAVEQAMLLFWERGYEATTLNDLRSALGGLSPASFYAAFGSKEALFGECLSLYMQSCGQLATLLADTTDGPREAMRRTLHAAVTAQTSRTRPRGCMAVLSGLNCFEGHEDIAAQVEQARRQTSQAITACVQAGRDVGELCPDVDCTSLATAFDVFLKGIAIQARDGRRAIELHAAVDALMAIWDCNALRAARQH